jgi:hypothetical protein
MLASMQIRNAFYRLAKSLSEEKQCDRAVEVLQKAEKTVSLNLWPVDYQSILIASLYSPNGHKDLGEKRFKELSSFLEETLTYLASFPPQKRKSISHEAQYQLSLYNELINQAAGTLPQIELKRMKEKLMWFVEKLR